MSVGRSSSILVVNGDPVSQEFFLPLLAGEGYRVAVTEDADEAVALLREQAFDLIIVDVLMPDAEGATLIAILRAFGCTAPVIGLSPRLGRARVGQVGFDPDEVVDCVGTVLAAARTAGAAAPASVH